MKNNVSVADVSVDNNMLSQELLQGVDKTASISKQNKVIEKNVRQKISEMQKILSRAEMKNSLQSLLSRNSVSENREIVSRPKGRICGFF